MTMPTANNDIIRHTVHYTGRVQGVGFRFTTCHVAAGFDVTGYVKNLRDGRVELVAEGRADEVTRFLGGVAEALGRYVRDTQVAASPAMGKFTEPLLVQVAPAVDFRFSRSTGSRVGVDVIKWFPLAGIKKATFWVSPGQETLSFRRRIIRSR